MNRDDIIEMARDLLEIDDFGADLTDENILRFAAVVAVHEREACAALVDDMATQLLNVQARLNQNDQFSSVNARVFGAAIRARGEAQ